MAEAGTATLKARTANNLFIASLRDNAGDTMRNENVESLDVPEAHYLFSRLPPAITFGVHYGCNDNHGGVKTDS